MESARLIQIVSVFFLLTGCKNQEDRINEAVPVSHEVEFSRLNYSEAAKSHGNDFTEFDNAYSNQLKVRAITCSNGYQPSMLESKESLAAKLTDAQCFAEADLKLNLWIGNKLAGLLLGLPALRPIPKLPPKAITSPEGIRTAVFADEAGVALLATHDGKLRLVDISDSSSIRLLDVELLNQFTLSSNGRLLAFQSGNRGGVDIYNTESGNRVTTLPEAVSGSIFWIGDKGAVYLKKSTMSPVFIDFKSGVETLVPVSGSSDLMVKMSISAPDEYFFMTGNRIAKVRMSVGKDIKPEIASESMIEPYRPIWQQSHMTRNGTFIALGASGDILIADSSKLKFRSMALMPFRVVGGIVPAQNPNAVILSGIIQGAENSRVRYLYDSAKELFFPIDEASAYKGYPFIYIRSIKRNAIIDGNRVIISGALELGPPIEAQDFSRRMQAESQIAMLDSQTQMQEMYRMRQELMARNSAYVKNPAPAPVLAGVAGTKAVAEASVGPSLPGEKGLVEGLRNGRLRLGGKADIARWKQSGGNLSEGGFESIITNRAVYVIVRDFYVPTGLTGANGVTFILERNVPFPNGDLGHSVVLDMGSGRCLGKLCR
jgi:hypothetical protein